jgi:hypothetical protein
MTHHPFYEIFNAFRSWEGGYDLNLSLFQSCHLLCRSRFLGPATIIQFVLPAVYIGILKARIFVAESLRRLASAIVSWLSVTGVRQRANAVEDESPYLRLQATTIQPTIDRQGACRHVHWTRNITCST